MALMTEHHVIEGCGTYLDSPLSPSRPLVCLMGGLCEALPEPLIYRKGWALLGYLALESNRLHSRSMLARLFWPNLGETSALTNLRQVLSNLNRYCEEALGPGILRISRASVGLMRPAHALFDIDVLSNVPSAAGRTLSDERAFLPGYEDIASMDFQIWLETSRQRLEAALVRCIEQHCDELIAARDWERVVPLANTLCLRDPWNEVHAQRLMRVHAATGSQRAAFNVYQQIESILSSELGLRTNNETRRLLMEICERRQGLEHLMGSQALAG